MVYSMDQLAQQGGPTQVLTIHRSDLGGCASRALIEAKRVKESLRDWERPGWIVLLVNADSRRRLSEMHADVFHLVTLVPWLNKSNAFLRKKPWVENVRFKWSLIKATPGFLSFDFMLIRLQICLVESIWLNVLAFLERILIGWESWTRIKHTSDFFGVISEW